ncbi:MAG: sensor histidine kinase [Candidatus Geothermincolia bacterium]
MKANPTQIYQLFRNLISNAIRHNDGNDPFIEIKYLGLDKESRHEYQVKDNGPGIPETDLKKVFLPFIKGTSGDAGIGLATVEKIVKAYGGTIEVTNDGGACFTFTIADFGDE